MGRINLKGFRLLRLTAAFLVLFLALWGCSDMSVLKNLKTAESNNSGGGGGGGTPTTIKWVADGSYIQFYTNDKTNYGYTFYVAYSSESQTVPWPKNLNGTAFKVSGALGEPYGFVFNYQDSNNFDEVMIEADQWYSVWQVVGGSYTALVSWVNDATHLVYGLNQPNSVTIHPTGVTNQYALFINGSGTLATFIDSTFTSGGQAGFKINIGDTTDENFPAIAEDVRFNLTSPAAKP